jgi:FixJ family two-component response regulator
MNPDQSFLMAQVEALLKMAEQLARFPLNGKIAPGIEENLKKLESIIQRYDDALSSGQQITRPLTPLEQKIHTRYSELGMLAAGLGSAMNVAVETVKRRRGDSMSKNTKKSIQKRQRKFKGVGGNEKWKKL